MKKLDIKRVYLPAMTAALIVLMLLPSFTPAMSQTTYMARALPTLQVTTIAEDDEVRQTGVIVLSLNPAPGWDPTKPPDPYCTANPGACQKKEAQYKMIVSFAGIPQPFAYTCEFVKKEKLHPLQKPQGTYEILRTVLTDESANFKCKFRTTSPATPGVGVLDVYYVGPQEKQFMADYIMVVSVWETIGRTIVYGSDLQDICVIGWAVGEGTNSPANTMIITKPDGTLHFSWPDPLGPFHSCEDLALWERANQGLPLLYD